MFADHPQSTPPTHAHPCTSRRKRSKIKFPGSWKRPQTKHPPHRTALFNSTTRGLFPPDQDHPRFPIGRPLYFGLPRNRLFWFCRLSLVGFDSHITRRTLPRESAPLERLPATTTHFLALQYHELQSPSSSFSVPEIFTAGIKALTFSTFPPTTGTTYQNHEL